MSIYSYSHHIVITSQAIPLDTERKELVMLKVNLNDIKANLVTRGRHPFTDIELEKAIKALDPKVDGDAFIYAECDPTDENYIAVKAKYRNRVTTVSGQLGIAVTALWTVDGQLVVGLKQVKKKK